MSARSSISLAYESLPIGDPQLVREEIRDLPGIEALKPDYDKLQQATGNTLPFALHEWHLTWCRHFLNAGGGVVDQPLFQVLRDPAGACVAIIPLIVSRRRFGMCEFVSLGLLGADPAITEIRTSLVAPGYERLVAQSIRAGFEPLRQWDWIQWTGLPDDFLATVAPANLCQAREPLETYELDLPRSWGEFRSGLKRNIRESLRHCYNSLKRDGHDYELQVITQPADIQGALDLFLGLHVKRAAMRNSRPHPNRFENDVARRFLYEVCGQLAACGVVRIFQLKIGGQIVASRLGFVVAGSLYLYYSGYDPAWARYSVMTTTVAEAIKYAIAHGLKTVNLSPNIDLSKTRWGPRAVQFPLAYESNPRLRSRLASRAYIEFKHGSSLPTRMLRRVVSARRRWD